jgi:endonuclease/exonuclease/phosphatase family metal-dependent hydrolase
VGSGEGVAVAVGLEGAAAEVVDEGDVQTMLDHILLPKELMPTVKRVVIAHVNDLHLSDHFPVIVDLDLQ